MDATIDAITADVVHDALRAIRYARPLRDSPLIDLRAVGAGLRSESLADTRQSRTWALSRLLAAQVAGRLTELRGDAPGREAQSAGEHEARAHLARDFEGRAFEQQAWGLLDYHYFRPEPLTLVQLAEALDVSRNTLDRRLSRGYRLLAERLRAAELEAARQGEGLAGTPVAERILVEEQGTDDGPIELMAALIAVARSEDAVARVTTEQLRRLGSYPASELVAYRLGRIAEWSQPRYRLDRRFVGMRLLVDAGEDAAQGRWQPQEKRYGDLAEALAEQSGPALVLLGPPGSGKSTLLRRLELDLAADGLRAGQKGAQAAPVPVTVLVSLARYRPAAPGGELPEPGAWLAGRWAARFPGLPPLERLMAEGPLLLLLDGLNEMPHESPAELRAKVLAWKHFLHEELAPRPGCRAVLACRSLDYSAPLSSPSLRVPQLRLEPLDDAAVRDFLARHNPNQAEAIWRRLAGRPILEALRWPFFLGLLCEEAGEGGDLPAGLAGLFTDFLRRGLRREMERDNPLFGPGGVLDEHDRARLAGGRGWGGVHGLPESGPLLRRLAGLARAMQAGGLRGERMQLRLSHAEALAILGPAGRELLAAGEALGVLDEDPVADEVLFQHQLLQEYFAAREMARAPEPERVRVEWRAAQIRPSLDEVIDALDPADPLPGLPQTGWEETTLLAATMAEDPASFLRGVMGTNLALAGRAAAQPDVQSRLPEEVLDELRWALVLRSRDPEADLRDRIACGYAVGDLGDPRFERRVGPHGEYLLPPLVEIPGGTYPIGDDEPMEYVMPGASDVSFAHMPRHGVDVADFRIGQFLVTNAEWLCFMEAGGYEDDCWWDTADAKRWQRGELANEAAKWNNRLFHKRFRNDPDLFEQMVEDGRIPSEDAIVRMRGWLAMDEAGFEAALDVYWQAKRETEPAYWRDVRYNHPTQPVVGVCWYEARAYCNWLAAQSGLIARLATEVEWEAAAGGASSRRFPWGDSEERSRANSIDMRVKRQTPVGVFAEGDSPERVTDLGGNAYEWTTSLFGEIHDEDHEATDFPYPYDPNDGREDLEAGPGVRRVVRGSSWDGPRLIARAASRDAGLPDGRNNYRGLRVAVSSSLVLSKQG